MLKRTEVNTGKRKTMKTRRDGRLRIGRITENRKRVEKRGKAVRPNNNNHIKPNINKCNQL